MKESTSHRECYCPYGPCHWRVECRTPEPQPRGLEAYLLPEVMPSKTKIAWFSRGHSPLPAQRAELRRLFGADCQIVESADTWGDAAEVAARIKATAAEEVVIIAPLSLIQHLLALGIRPLWPEMIACTKDFAIASPDRAVAAPRGRWFLFNRFRRLVEIKMKFEELP